MMFPEMSNHLFHFEDENADFKYFTSECNIDTHFMKYLDMLVFNLFERIATVVHIV